MISRILLGLGMFWVSASAAFADASRPELPANGDPSDTVAALLSVPEAEIDLTWSKLVIDELIDPDADLEASLAEIETIADTVLAYAGPAADDAQKVAVLRTYIYKSGEWNGNQPYSYDFEDPNGMRASHKSLSRYLKTRKGNCINMPFLFLAIGECMGVEMNVTTAPRHVFIQFDNPQTGKLEHLETTSGAQPQRIVWQRQVMPVTDRSLETGMYHQRLNKRQQVAVMAESLLHKAHEDGDYQERLELAGLMLAEFPQADVALLHTMGAYRDMIRTEIAPLYSSAQEMPPWVFQKYVEWLRLHDEAEAKLLNLGWQPAQANPNVIMPSGLQR